MICGDIITPVMENQMERTMETEMATRVLHGLHSCTVR